MLTFTELELELLGKTADALSAYMGKPVLAEVDLSEDGFEWVMFGVPLDINDAAEDEEIVHIQMGGPSARLLGNAGGLDDWQQEVYACEFLWGIQLTEQENIRFIRIDYTGEEVQWAETLEEMLPFAINDEELPSAEDNWDEDDDSDNGPENNPPAPTLH
ncbi:hypothetical protein ACM5Q9_09580 [Advenella sp. RU8]|uniref:hypothetical protein n=1 Tax=Advenella sp. RU8 TaxID=3399575 RepID=UPI003AAC2D44